MGRVFFCSRVCTQLCDVERKKSPLLLMEYHTFLLLLSILLQTVSTLFVDYDNDTETVEEAANYWEPLHYLLYGRGIQSWEWHRDYAIRSPFHLLLLSALGKIFQWVGMDRYFVFYSIRVFVGAVGSLGVYYFCHAVRKKFGEMIGVLTFLLTIFNTIVLLSLNRISMDSIMMILNLFIFGLWLENHVFLLTFFSVLTVMLRLNFLPVFGIIMLQLLFAWEERRVPFKEWAIQLFLYCLSTVLFWLGVFLAIDSYWYRKPTVAFINFLIVKIMRGQSSYMDADSTLKYLELLIQDNNIFILIGAIVGLYVTTRSRTYALPYLVSFVYLQLMSLKQERFLYFLLPILCLYCSICIFWILEFSFISPSSQIINSIATSPNGSISIKKATVDDLEVMPMLQAAASAGDLDPIQLQAQQSYVTNHLKVSTKNANKSKDGAPTPQKLTPKAIAVVTLIGIYLLTGLSTSLLRVYVHSPDYYFWNFEISALVAIDSQQPVTSSTTTTTTSINCLSTEPWVSWKLPLECKKIYIMPLNDEYFAGYNQVSFKRFESQRGESAFLPLYEGMPSKLPDDQGSWNESAQIKKVFAASKKANFYESSLEREAMRYIFILGGESISKKTKSVFKQVTGKSLRNKRQSSNSYYYETLWGPYLTDNFELVAEGYSLGSTYQVPYLSRQLGTWLFANLTEINDQKFAILSAWRRKNKRK